MADMRLESQDSVILRIGPSFVKEVKLGRGLDPSRTFDQMLTSEDRSHLPSMLDRYLSDLGLGLALRGDEMVPRRDLLVRMINETREMTFGNDVWARASMRMGNVISLAVRAAASLPVESTDSYYLVHEQALIAKSCYSRSREYEDLHLIAQGNEALLDHWCGRSEEAVSRLLSLLSGPAPRSEHSCQLAQIYLEQGHKEKAAALLHGLDPPSMTAWAKRLLDRSEGIS